MAELVGGALLSSFLGVVFERLASNDILELFRGKKEIPKLLEELKIRLNSAMALLDDAEEKQLGDQKVKKWLDDLKDVIYEADHVIDKINTEAFHRKQKKDGQSRGVSSKLKSLIPVSLSAFDLAVKAETEEIIRRLKLLLDQKVFLGLKSDGFSQNRHAQRILAPLVDESEVYGRDADKEAVVKLLSSDDVCQRWLSVIPIVGMGGIGKTTLAQIVYNDSRVQSLFDLKVWVTISEDFDVLKVTKTIIKKVTSENCDFGDLYQLQCTLKEILRGKRFLFVHDDVWNEDYGLWDALKSSFDSGAQGSAIVVTTRSQIVASMMSNGEMYKLQTISDNESQKLFAKHVLNNHENSCVYSELEKIGIEIVKKCKGLPLAVKSIAGVLRSESDPEAWRRVLRSDVWELQFQENQKNKVIPALWLSYHFLPSPLKRCFAYCSIFPKDYEFYDEDKKFIVLLWMAEGLLQPEKGKRMEDVGEECLNALISRSFFQLSVKSNSSTPILLMHDLVHDLAIRTSGEFCTFSEDSSNFFDELTSKTCHLSYRKGSKYVTKLAGLSLDNKRFRALLALPLSCHPSLISPMTNTTLNELLLTAGDRLRILSLAQSSILELPDSIGNLKHLRYLDLSSTKITQLPSSVCSLYNLQTLLLFNCYQLLHLPTNLCSLIGLRHLNIQCTYQNLRCTPLREMPPKICNMRNLQTLTNFSLSENSGSRINELCSLQLRGTLGIRGLQYVENNIMDALEANLKKKEFLEELHLIWLTGKTDASPKHKQVLDALEPHRNLKGLEIYGFRGTTFSDWVGHQSFHDMVKVKLICCITCSSLPPLGQLPSLQELEIEEMGGVISIGDEFCGTSLVSNPFPSLETLSIIFMESLEKWSFTETNEKTELFPRLKRLCISTCPKLNIGLPIGCFPSLTCVNICDCKSMVEVFPTTIQIQVPIDNAFPSLESMTVAQCPRLDRFSGLPSNLKALTVWDCNKLISNRLSWGLQRLSSLETLFLSGFFAKEDCSRSFPEEGLLPETLTELRLQCLRNLIGLNGNGICHLTSLRRLSITFCEQLERLPEQGLPLSLWYLEINNCPLLKPRCQPGTGQDWAHIQHVPAIEIDYQEI